MSHTRLRCVNHCTAEVVFGDSFAGNGLCYLWTSYEHIAIRFRHDDVVGESWRINCATCARTEDSRQLWNYARCFDVALEDFSVARKAGNAFLDTSATAIVQTDDRNTGLHCHIHNLADFLGVSFRQGATHYGEVLRENINHSATYCSVAGNNAVAEERFLFDTEVVASVSYKHVDFFEAAFVEEHVYSFAGSVFALLML